MKIRRLLAVFLPAVLFQILSAAESDTIQQNRSVVWHVGMEAVPAFVAQTNSFIRGNNPSQAKIQSNLSGVLRVGFNFDENTNEGQIYKGVYQGIGIGATSFFKQDLTHTPILAHVYQGAPIKHFSERLWLGYEWKFGAAMGWKHYDANANPNAPVSTAVTAHMALGIRLNYRLSDNWLVTLGIEGSHYSNGNTSIPNSGINTIGAVAGVTYIIDTRSNKKHPLVDQVTIQPEWFY
ncbi:MAG: acyloxyacyl hydrolase, partial [Muribaculaceae bacterium]|nr:acyloxyacyl hydrolase [Muribaculaceae bacterium]